MASNLFEYDFVNGRKNCHGYHASRRFSLTGGQPLKITNTRHLLSSILTPTIQSEAQNSSKVKDLRSPFL
ncbi:MAG: hypothetical protein F6K16_32410 [Symploca sp. SIO2B6]|nr:hypothetical protein [Symploca sp. SIO2B6]